MPADTSLDDVAAFRQLDPTGLLDRILDLPVQFERAWHQANQFRVPRSYRHADRVVFLGMGGSAIGADFVRVLMQQEAAVPVEVVRDYDIPSYAGRRTLVVACSFSGGTEETLSAVSQAIERGTRLLAVTSGGTLGRLAAEHRFPALTINYESEPRSAFAHTFTPLLAFMQQLGFLDNQTLAFEEGVGVVRGLLQRLGPDVPEAGNRAKQLARLLYGKLPVIAGGSFVSVAAQRWKTQLNENAKVWAVSETLPELNHNSVVGFDRPAAVRDVAGVVLLRSALLHPRILARYDITADLLKEHGIDVHVVEARGGTLLSQLMSLVAIGDIVSYYLAMLEGVDPSPVSNIDYIRRRLAEV